LPEDSAAPRLSLLCIAGAPSITTKPYWADAYLSKEKLARISPLVAPLAPAGHGTAATA